MCNFIFLPQKIYTIINTPDFAAESKDLILEMIKNYVKIKLILVDNKINKNRVVQDFFIFHVYYHH